MKNLREFVTSLTKGVFGIVIIAKTEPRMRKTNNPYFGRVQKVTRLANVAIGYNYENVVNNRLAQEGKTQLHFTAQKPNGKSWVKGYENLFLVADKDGKTEYLRTTMRKNTKPTTMYLVDGKTATDEEVAEIKTFIQSSYKPTNQGLDEGDEVIVRDYKVENVVSIQLGDKMWFND
jgi:hypothetical protein